MACLKKCNCDSFSFIFKIHDSFGYLWSLAFPDGFLYNLYYFFFERDIVVILTEFSIYITYSSLDILIMLILPTQAHGNFLPLLFPMPAKLYQGK